MDIRQLTARLDYIEHNRLYEGLTLTEAKSVKLWEHAGRLIKEANLTPDQIQQLFTSVEQGATAAGGNRTMIGQGKDAAEAIKKAYDDLVSKVQNSAPVKGADAMYDTAVAKIEAGLGGPDNAVNQVIQKYRAFAKEHPIAQGLIYSILIAAAGISGVGLGGAAVLGLLKMTDKLLQGEKFSTAVGKGLATGATAYAAGQIGQAMKGGDTAAGNIGAQPTGASAAADRADAVRFGLDPNASHDSIEHARGILEPKFPGSGFGNSSGTLSGITGQQMVDNPAYKDALSQHIARYGNSPQAMSAGKSIARAAAKAAEVAQGGIGAAASDVASKSAYDTIASRIANGDINPGDFGKMRELAQTMVADSGLSGTSAEIAAEKAVTMAMGNAARAAGGQAVSVAGNLVKESIALSENQIATLFTLIQIKNRQFNEGMWDNIKNKAATVGKNLTTKVTADKLNSAWKKAGSPTDSEQVSQVIQGAGVDPAVVSKSFTDMGIAAPAAKTDPTLDPAADAAAPAADPTKPDELDAIKKNAGLPVVNIKDMLAQILALTTEEQKQVLAYLKK